MMCAVAAAQAFSKFFLRSQSLSFISMAPKPNASRLPHMADSTWQSVAKKPRTMTTNSALRDSFSNYADYLNNLVVIPTVESDVAFGFGKLNFTKEEVRTRVRKALDSVGMLLYLQRPVQTLSGGQKQRVAIAGALAETCRVLLLDELTTFLDESDQIGVVKEVTALWVTHRLEELEYADGAVYMEDGSVVQVGSPSSICYLIKKRQALYIEQINS